jgi:hypothetical protein
MSIVKHIQSLCAPARVYCLISLFFVIVALFTKFEIIHTLLMLLFVILMSLFLNLLCTNGLKWLSWLLVIVFLILPLVLAFLGIKGKYV